MNYYWATNGAFYSKRGNYYGAVVTKRENGWRVVCFRTFTEDSGGTVFDREVEGTLDDARMLALTELIEHGIIDPFDLVVFGVN